MFLLVLPIVLPDPINALRSGSLASGVRLFGEVPCPLRRSAAVTLNAFPVTGMSLVHPATLLARLSAEKPLECSRQNQESKCY